MSVLFSRATFKLIFQEFYFFIEPTSNMLFFREVLSVCRTQAIFLEFLSIFQSNTGHFPKSPTSHTDFFQELLFLIKEISISRKPYLVIEHIRNFQEKLSQESYLDILFLIIILNTKRNLNFINKLFFEKAKLGFPARRTYAIEQKAFYKKV